MLPNDQNRRALCAEHKERMRQAIERYVAERASPTLAQARLAGRDDSPLRVCPQAPVPGVSRAALDAFASLVGEAIRDRLTKETLGR